MYDCLIIGAGIIGLTLGLRFTLEGKKTLILEAKPNVGQETSFRNSAVVHAGIYYPTQSLKALLCVQGKILLQNYCKQQNIPYFPVGKLIVASNKHQMKQLLELKMQGERNGNTDLILLDQTEVSSIEPNIEGFTALYSPNTAIVNGQSLLQNLKKDFLQAGGELLTDTLVDHCEVHSNYFKVMINRIERSSFNTKMLINAAGLGAQYVAKNIHGLAKEHIPPLFYAKGNYFKYLKPNPFKHLIYPIPETAGLGIHATMDTENNIRFGPDVEWVSEINYKTTLSRKKHFEDAIKLYYPELDENALVADDQHTGIRPKIIPPNEQPQDFLIQTSKSHGIEGLVNLYGIESPGLTASFAIAEYVLGRLTRPSPTSWEREQ